ncbi:MAG: SDR family oxidoreductase [Anaerolineae bacterium]|nr:SDR family oxidoreductase [Anaerolineae bacterium]MDK1080965.1 SDR family oxidoreductase [Anaerolineae bacterium]MDK1117885.1 SDR family oxidoreductase [Anaerolineae bacterium]
MEKYPLAVVTGGAHRLGRALAYSLARLGYAVLIHYHHSGQEARKTVDEIKKYDVPGYCLQADLTQPDQITSLFSSIDLLLSDHSSQLSNLAVWVNSAAVMPRGEALSLPLEQWDIAINLNLRAPFLNAQQASRRMKRGGLIVNISDIGAAKAWSRFPSYTVSKAALESLTKVLARSFAPMVRVNAIAPGLVLPSNNVSDKEWDKLVGNLPLKRPAKPEEIYSALGILLKNEYITGQTIAVDGGYSLL